MAGKAGGKAGKAGGKGKGKGKQAASESGGRGEYNDGSEMVVLKRGKEEDDIMSKYMVGKKK